MRKFYFLFFALYTLLSNAQTVSINEAKNLALRYLGNYPKANTRSEKTKGDLGLELTLVHTEFDSNDGTTPLFYIFDINNNDGFIITSADNRTCPILATIEQGRFIENILNENLSYFLQMYSEQISYIKESSDITIYSAANKTKQEILPLLKDSWGQGAPYNSKCPTISGALAKVGCVALAMAQVMNYWEYPKKGTGSHSYYWANGRKTVNSDFFSHKYYWDKFYPFYGTNSQEEKDAIGTLLFDCGVSVDMDYDKEVSLAYSTDAISALKNYFAYSIVDYYRRDSYSGNWDDLLYDELSKGKPLIYSGEKSNSTGGHCFVCDGYKDGLFHFNWGWNGDNGYFATSALNPRKNNFNYHQDIIAPQPYAGYTAPEKIKRVFSIEGRKSKSVDVSAEKQKVSVQIEANCFYTISCYSDWVKLSATEGTGDYVLEIEVDANEKEQSRGATINFYTWDLSTNFYIDLTQEKNILMSVENNYYDIPATSQEIQTSYTAKGNIDVVTSDDWISISEVTSSSMSFRIATNNSTHARFGNILIILDNKDKTKREINIRQNGNNGEAVRNYVDLGLPSGVHWANINIGASDVDDYGYYFVWGETSPRFIDSGWETRISALSDMTQEELQSKGIVDECNQLNLAYDAVYNNWGEKWRMPTNDEINELMNSCIIEMVDDMHVYKLIGPNGNHIYLPFYKDGYYGGFWSSYATNTSCRSLFYNSFSPKVFVSDRARMEMLPVRPVYDINIESSIKHLEDNSNTLEKCYDLFGRATVLNSQNDGIFIKGGKKYIRTNLK